ncbi:MAG: response regulator [Chryseobacterium sp.]|nr:MAG: response regulator [Chryseobacterium sp.]
MRCYIVDDEKQNIMMITHFIHQTYGLELVVKQTNPLIALEEINSLKPDVVFTDIDMPEMDGITLSGLIQNMSMIVCQWKSANILFGCRFITLNTSMKVYHGNINLMLSSHYV